MSEPFQGEDKKPAKRKSGVNRSITTKPLAPNSLMAGLDGSDFKRD